MQYIDFSEDMLYPSDENLIGLPNGFRLSDYDSDALNFTHGHLPPPLTTPTTFLNVSIYTNHKWDLFWFGIVHANPMA